ncbi:hypothetical protein PR048_031276 [Dryococelus australis]|uniref:Uncharacterized protein n=1 Tax=Dryococelus australis TaxID=614101 RepID=A0ABQ9G4S7_9NEOP|nr:hypothetical protein PR048_031276 [Dryococelus australis]
MFTDYFEILYCASNQLRSTGILEPNIHTERKILLRATEVLSSFYAHDEKWEFMRVLRCENIRKLHEKRIRYASIKVDLRFSGATVAERLACSPPTKTNWIRSPPGSRPDFSIRESWRAMPLVCGFSRGSPLTPPFRSDTAPHTPQSPSSALKTSLLRVAKISSLTCGFKSQRLAGETGEPRENPPTSFIVRHDFRVRKSGSGPDRESNPVRPVGRRLRWPGLNSSTLSYRFGAVISPSALPSHGLNQTTPRTDDTIRVFSVHVYAAVENFSNCFIERHLLVQCSPQEKKKTLPNNAPRWNVLGTPSRTCIADEDTWSNLVKLDFHSPYRLCSQWLRVSTNWFKTAWPSVLRSFRPPEGREASAEDEPLRGCSITKQQIRALHTGRSPAFPAEIRVIYAVSFGETWPPFLGVGAAVAERLARLPPTKANRVQFLAGSPDFRKWESCRTMPLVGGFSQGSPVFPRAPTFRRRSILASFAHIDSVDINLYPVIDLLMACRLARSSALSEAVVLLVGKGSHMFALSLSLALRQLMCCEGKKDCLKIVNRMVMTLRGQGVGGSGADIMLCHFGRSAAVLNLGGLNLDP